MGKLSKKSDSDLKDELLAMKFKVEDMEEAGQTDSQLYKNFTTMIDSYEQEIYLRRPNNPVTVSGMGPNASNSGRKISNVRGGFKNLCEQLGAVMRAANPSSQTDARLYNAATGLNEQVPSSGGFLVHSDFSSELLKSVYSTGKLAKLCNRIQISGNSNSIKLPAPDESSRANGSRWGGTQAYWIDEAAEKTASKPTFRQMELTLKKLVDLCYATDELLSDFSMLETIIQQSFAEEFGFLIDEAIISGSGAGQPLGIMNSGSLVTVNKESGQSSGTYVWENAAAMWARLLPGSQDRAVWLINADVYPALFSMSLATGTGGVPVYMPANGAAGEPYGTLFGRPVMPIEQCSTLGTTGDVILADFGGGYLLAEKGGMKSDMSIHVAFVTDQSCFRFVLRLDGQTVRETALTPFKGSNSQSHFVALQTRS